MIIFMYDPLHWLVADQKSDYLSGVDLEIPCNLIMQELLCDSKLLTTAVIHHYQFRR